MIVMTIMRDAQIIVAVVGEFNRIKLSPVSHVQARLFTVVLKAKTENQPKKPTQNPGSVVV